MTQVDPVSLDSKELDKRNYIFTKHELMKDYKIDFGILNWIPYHVKFQFHDRYDHVNNMLVSCYEQASLSPDPSTQVGSVVVDYATLSRRWMFENCNSGCGHNAMPRHIMTNNIVPELMCNWENREQKLLHVEHAERNAIWDYYNRLIKTNSRLGLAPPEILYCTMYACSDCAKAIIGAKIGKCIGHLNPYICATKESSQWVDILENSFCMLHDCGVECLIYVPPLMNCAIGSIRTSTKPCMPTMAYQDVLNPESPINGYETLYSFSDRIEKSKKLA